MNTETPRRILVVEDEPNMGSLVCAVLRREGFIAVHVATPDDAQREMIANDVVGMVLDLGLGDRSGLELLRQCRVAGADMPVVVLTADSADETIVRALDAGADDYVVKPLRPLEFAARVRAVMRRPSPEAPDETAIGALRLRRLEREITADGKVLKLSPREFSLLEYLILRAGYVATRAELLARVWKMDGEAESNLVDVHVARLRRKLDQVQARVKIEAKRGVGFALVPSLSC